MKPKKRMTAAARLVMACGLVGSAPLGVLAADAPTANAAASTAPATAPSAPTAQGKAAVEKGVEFLKQQQKPDGGWQEENEPPAFTAIVLQALVQSERFDSHTDFIKNGYEKLLSYQLEDGGIYQDLLANYNTAIALSALTAANDPAFKQRIDRGVAYLKGLQWTEKTAPGPKGEKVNDPKNPWYGGTGYGHGRPDGSNTQLALQALHDAGLKPDDPAFKAAVHFLNRQQNRSESNDQPWAGDDGGAIYTPANNGVSEAGEYTSPDGKRMLRSYGSMTYGMLKSMIYAGLTKDDPRVKAALEWISKNYTLDENPGMKLSDPKMADDGLYYYYMTFAKALDAYDEPTITDAKGNKHDWRIDLINKLTSLQSADGSWTGDKRWMESKPNLATSYALLALQAAMKDLQEHPAAAKQ